MNLLIVTPQLRRIGRVAISHWNARKAWGRPHTFLELSNQAGVEDNDQVLAKYQDARAIFLGGTYDAMLTLEDDILIPDHAIESLVGAAQATGAGIAYSLYVWRRSAHPWSAYTSIDNETGESMMTSDPDRARRLAQTAGIAEVAGLGNGCTLIMRDTVERIPFRSYHNRSAAQDWALAVDAKAAGIKQVCHFGVQCGHVEIRGQYKIYWPDAGAESMWHEEVIDAAA